MEMRTSSVPWAHPEVNWLRAAVSRGAVVALAVLAASCGTTRFEPKPSIPRPLIARIPAVVGIYMSPEFRTAVHTEERDGAKYEITLGKPQSEGFERLMEAMFTRTVPVTATNAGATTDPQIRGVLEPILEDYSFVTPRDAGARIFAVSLKYRINGYDPTGKMFESWTFTGYGSVPAPTLPGPSAEPLQEATALAMRDAGAKLAAEFRDAAIARGLLPAEGSAAPAEVTPLR
jgi:hypothetical protein